MNVKLALSAIWFGLRNTYEELFTIAGVNLVWLGIGFIVPIVLAYFDLPLIGLLALLITLPPPTAGAHYYANRIAHDKSAKFADFWEGTKKYAVKSWIFAFFDVLALATFLTNIYFYGRAFEGRWVLWVQSLFFALILYWMAMQIYIWPMLLELKEEKLLLAVRNAAFLAVGNPLVTLVVGLAVVLIIAISVFLTLPAVFIVIGTVTLITNRTVVSLIQHYREEASET